MGCNNAFGVLFGTFAVLLDEGVNLSVHKGAVRKDADSNHRGIAADAGYVNAVGSAEVSQAIGNESAFVHFHTAGYMGTMSINHISTMVDAEMGEITQIAAVFSKIGLGPAREVALVTAFCASMEGDYYYIAVLT